MRAAERAFTSCGGYEDLIEASRGMLPIVRSTGMKINYAESRDGHFWESWRDQLGPGLCWLLPDASGGSVVRLPHKATYECRISRFELLSWLCAEERQAGSQ